MERQDMFTFFSFFPRSLKCVFSVWILYKQCSWQEDVSALHPCALKGKHSAVTGVDGYIRQLNMILLCSSSWSWPPRFLRYRNNRPCHPEEGKETTMQIFMVETPPSQLCHLSPFETPVRPTCVIMRSPSENCLAPNTSTIFILSVACTETGHHGKTKKTKNRKYSRVRIHSRAHRLQVSFVPSSLVC